MKVKQYVKSEDGERWIFKLLVWVWMRLFRYNLKRGTLQSYRNPVYDTHGEQIDTMGNSGDFGRWIETYRDEMVFVETIRTKYFIIHLVFD